MNRRSFLKGTAAGAIALATGRPLALPALAADPSGAPTKIDIVRRTIEVKGRAATVFGLQQPDGTRGIRLDPGASFNVLLRNQSPEATIVHWHGLVPPWPSDGV